MSIGFINGKFIPVDELVLPIDERGHNFGDGVYEVIRIYQGNPFMLEEHLERLSNSAAGIRLHLPYSPEEIKEFIYQGIEKSGLLEAQVYVQITRGIATRQHTFPDVPASMTMTVRPVSLLPVESWEKGVSAITLPDERWANCHIKSLNLLPNILARQIAYEQGCFEAILIRDGYVTEGTSSTVYIIKDEQVLTTPLTKFILPGITRTAILELISSLNLTLVEKQITLEELRQADEIFLTSTTIEVLPIVRLDGNQIGSGIPGELTKTLQKHFQTLYA